MTGDLFGQPPVPGRLTSILERSAVLDGPFRFSLFRRWERDRPLAAWLMCNPSNADAEKDDRTLQRVIYFSAKRGMGGAIVVNVFPHRTPYPSDLWKMLADSPMGDPLSARNGAHIRAAAERAHVAFVGFGAEIPKRHPEALDRALHCFSRAHLDWLCLGTNGAGWPLHPLSRGKLAIRNDSRMTIWEPPT